MDPKNNCIQFKNQPHVPCENIEFENFDNEQFNEKQFNKQIQTQYNNKNFKFDENYINEKPSQGQYTIRQQQKFVPKYANFHTNSQGLLIYHGLGSGKCLALDTPVLMYDGTIKKVQNIKPREFVMGDDSTPREVLSLGRGQQQMYDIVPTKGNTFGCNSEHILCLKTSNKGVYYKKDKRCKNQKKFWVAEWVDTKSITKKKQWFETKEEAELFFDTIENDTINIEVKDFIKLPKSIQSQLKLYRTGVEFREQETPLEPYIIGLWLGDEESLQNSTISIHTLHEPNSHKYTSDNYFWNTIKSLNLINNKHIPNIYKINSRNNRLQLLAGLIDTNGSLKFNIINETLAHDIEYLVQSLGFYTKIQKCKKYSQNGTEETYYRMRVSGNIQEIPTKKQTKLITDIGTQNKNVLVTGFKVIPKGIGNYYGFTVDKNHKFLLGDFTVTHNTCTSILVGEAYKAFHEEKELRKGTFPSKDNRIIVVLPPATVEQFKEELYGEYNNNKEYTGCVSNIQYDGEDISYIKAPIIQKSKISNIKSTVKTPEKSSKKTTRTSRAEKNLQAIAELEVQKYWNITTYIKFINGLVHRKDEDTIMNLTKQLQRGGQLVIIDEIQNLISESGILYKKLINTIRMFSHNNKFVVLSATPIYDKPFEIGLTLNLLNPRLFFPSNQIDFNKLFFKKNTSTEENKRDFIISDSSLFYWMCSGYISYFSGGNPLNFPFKRIIEVHHKMNENQARTYFQVLISEIKENPKTKEKTDEETNDQLNQNYLSKARAFCNITYPSDNDKKKQNPKQKIIEMKTQLKTIYESDKNVENVLSNVEKEYSTKLANIVKNIIKSEGTVLIFSDLIYYGVDAIAAILEVLEYTSIGPKELKNVDIKQNINLKKGKNHKRFSVWSGENIQPSEKQMYSTKIRSIFNNENNSDGKHVKIILGTTSIMEGISFLNVRDVHIVNPWWNESRLQQVIARAVRFRSHDALPLEKRFVNVYKHYSVLSSFPESSMSYYTNQMITNGNRKKIDLIARRGLFLATVDQHIGRRAKEKKEDSRDFELLMKASAVDCQLNKNANLTRLEENIIPQYNTNRLSSETKGWLMYYENPSNGKTYFKESNNTITNHIDDIEKHTKSITYIKNNESNLKFIPCKKFYPPLYKDSTTRTSFYSYEKTEGIPLILQNENRIESVTKEYVINENIECVREQYNHSPGLEKSAMDIYNNLVNETNAYKEIIEHNGVSLGERAEVVTNVLYPKNTKFLDTFQEDKLTQWLANKIKKTKKLQEGYKKWVKKSDESQESKEKKKLLFKILTNKIPDYNSNLMDPIVTGEKEATIFLVNKIKDKLQKAEDEIQEIIKESKRMYMVLEGLDIKTLENIVKNL